MNLQIMKKVTLNRISNWIFIAFMVLVLPAAAAGLFISYENAQILSEMPKSMSVENRKSLIKSYYATAKKTDSLETVAGYRDKQIDSLKFEIRILKMRKN